MRTNIFIGSLFLFIILQSGVLGWLLYQQSFSIDSAWNRYLAGERMLHEAEVSGSSEQIRTGIAMMDESHKKLLAAGEIVRLFVADGSDLEKIIQNNGIRNLLNGTQGLGGQRAVHPNGQTMEIDVRMLRFLEKFHPKALPAR